MKKAELADCLLEEKTTWLNIRGIPTETCSLKLEPEISAVRFYWTEKFQGVNPEGTLFDKKTGRKILNDADIKVNSTYYLLVSNSNIFPTEGVTVKILIQKNICGKNWRLYEIEANELTEKAAKFFLEYHCRLTAMPISIVPLYPVYTQENDIIHCNSKKMFFYFSGNAKVRIFPFSKKTCLSKENKFKLIETEFAERAQMIAVGRAELLQYAYIWQDLPTAEVELPKIEVKNIRDEIISDGIAYILPKNSRLQVTAQFDVKIIKSKNNIVLEKIFFKAGMTFDIKDITFGTEIKIFQGLDCIWKILYQRQEKGI